MASDTDTQKPSELTVCSICFENFRTPRILPCTHVFCHGCISSYIVTSCQSKEAPVGFSCPLCRKFVPSPSDLSYPEKWADGLPVCKIFDMLNKQQTKLCAACLRENEEEEATDFCVTCQESMCRNCVKYHKRSLASSNHGIVSLKEPMSLLYSITSERNSRCFKHPDKEEEWFCDDHKRVCCSTCASTEHQKCVNFKTVKSVAEPTKIQGKAQKLLKTINYYKQGLLRIKKNQEQNLKDIVIASDTIKEETTALRREINEHLDKLEQEHLNELSKITKESSIMVGNTIDSASNRIQLIDHYQGALSNLEDATDTYLVREYQRVWEGFDALKGQSMNPEDYKFKFDCTISEEAYAMKTMKCFSPIKVLRICSVELNIFKFSLSLLYEFDVLPYADIYCGVFGGGKITLAKFGSSKIGLQQFSLDDATSRRTNEYRSFDCLFGLALKGNLFYATVRNKNCVAVISNETFKVVRTFSVDENYIPYGICLWNDYLFIACQTAILKYNINGRFIHCYPVDFNTLFVSVTKSGNIVYSNTVKNCVVAIDTRGDEMWKYTDWKLQSPHGVDQDGFDNLFVASTKTNTVHILSCDGAFIRIIEDISKPVFMKIDESSKTCCVCCNFRKIKVYRIK